MTKEARMCVESCREWYQAFSNFGKGEERSVKELLAVAALIESLSAQLDQVTRERDAAVEESRGYCSTCAFKRPCIVTGCVGDMGEACKQCPCLDCADGSNWQWRGVEKEVEG